MIFVSPIRSAFSKKGGNNLTLRQLENKSVTLWRTFLTFQTLRILVWYWSFLVFSSTLDQDQYCCLALKCTQCSPVSVSQQGIDFTFSYYSFISNSITQSFIFQLLETRNTQQKEGTFWLLHVHSYQIWPKLQFWPQLDYLNRFSRFDLQSRPKNEKHLDIVPAKEFLFLLQGGISRL